MWTIDYTLQLAKNGYSGAYLHTREAGIPYNIFQPATGTSDWQTGPPYYALLLLTDAFSTKPSSGAIPNARGNAVVDITPSMSSRPDQGAGYAIYDASGIQNPPRAMVLINYQDNAGSTTSFAVPPGLTKSSSSGGKVLVRMLSAPNVREKNAIMYEGQSVNGQGFFTGKSSTTTVSCAQGCNIDIPGPGVALVMLQNARQSGAQRLRGGKLLIFSGQAVAILSTLVVTLLMHF